MAISAFGVPGSKASSAYALTEEGVFDLAVSPQILEEIRTTLGGPKFGLSDERLDQIEALISELATFVEPDFRLSVLEDEPDNRILECAVAAGASAIVTGDKELLALKSHEGIGIMTVAELLYTFPEFGA